MQNSLARLYEIKWFQEQRAEGTGVEQKETFVNKQEKITYDHFLQKPRTV